MEFPDAVVIIIIFNILSLQKQAMNIKSGCGGERKKKEITKKGRIRTFIKLIYEDKKIQTQTQQS